MSRRQLLLGVAAGAIARPARARSLLDIAGRHMQEPSLVGKSRFSYLFWDVYDAFLFAPERRWSEDAPQMLALRYLRALDGPAIVDRSIEEMRRQGPIDAETERRWRAELERAIDDVDEGVELACARDAEGFAHFYRDGAQTAVARDPAFTSRFLGIWLSEATSEPELRDALLGL